MSVCLRRYIFRSMPYFVVLALLTPVQVISAESGSSLNIQYGRVVEEKAVDVKKHVGEATLIGGALGAATIDSGSRRANVVAGAVAGAGMEAVGEWRMKGTRYAIDTIKGEDIHIITDQTGIHVGDCVAIEATAKHANLRRVSDTYCETASSGADDHHLDARMKKAAVDCYLAKKALLGAEGKDELEAAKHRVRALCDT